MPQGILQDRTAKAAKRVPGKSNELVERCEAERLPCGRCPSGMACSGSGNDANVYCRTSQEHDPEHSPWVAAWFARACKGPKHLAERLTTPPPS